MTDEAGNVLGSLCAIDSEPRQWTAAQLDLLRDLADACSTELRLRLARFDAREERRRRDELEQRLQRSFDRSQTLLAAPRRSATPSPWRTCGTGSASWSRPSCTPRTSGSACSTTTGGMRRMLDARHPAGSRAPDPGRPTTSSPRCRPPRRCGSGGSSPTPIGPASTPTIPSRPAGCSGPRPARGRGRPAAGLAGRSARSRSAGTPRAAGAGGAAHRHDHGRVRRAGPRPRPAAATPRQRRPPAAAGDAHHPAGRPGLRWLPATSRRTPVRTSAATGTTPCPCRTRTIPTAGSSPSRSATSSATRSTRRR